MHETSALMAHFRRIAGLITCTLTPCCGRKARVRKLGSTVGRICRELETPIPTPIRRVLDDSAQGIRSINLQWASTPLKFIVACYVRVTKICAIRHASRTQDMLSDRASRPNASEGQKLNQVRRLRCRSACSPCFPSAGNNSAAKACVHGMVWI